MTRTEETIDECAGMILEYLSEIVPDVDSLLGELILKKALETYQFVANQD